MECACSRPAQWYVARGNQFFDKAKYADAELQYRNSIQRNPKFAEGYYRLGLAELQLQKPADALADLQRAVRLDTTNDIYRIQLANLALVLYHLDPSNQNLYNYVAGEAARLLKLKPNSFDGLRLQGNILSIDRKPEEALALFQRANAIEPFDPNVELPMVQLLFTLQRPKEAESLASKFLQRRKDFAPMYDLLLSYYATANRPKDAEQLLRMKVANRPKDAKAWLQLAAFYGDSKQEQEMSDALQKILNDRADFPEGPGMVGDFYAGGGRWEDALREYREGLHSDPKYSHLYETKIASTLISAGRKNEAVAKLGEILKAFPKDPDARLKRAILLGPGAGSKEVDLAIADLKVLVQQRPTDPVARYNLGIAYRAKGDIPAAQTELRKSAGLGDNYLPPYFVLAEIALDQRDYLEAARFADQILSVDSANVDARILRSAALTGSKEYAQARQELDALIREKPDSKDVSLRLAALDTAQAKYQDAETQYRRLYQPGSTDLRPFEGLLELYLDEKQPAKAEALLDEEIGRSPNSRPVHFLLASTAMKEGKLDVARQQYEWVRSVDPNSVQAYLSLGALYEMQGKTKESLDSYLKAGQLAPNDSRILGSIAILQSKLGATGDAIHTLEKQLARDPKNANAMNNLAFNLAESGKDLDRALLLAESAVRSAPDNPAFMDTLGWVYAKRGLDQSAIQVFRVLVKKYPKEQAYRDHLEAVLSHGKKPTNIQSPSASNSGPQSSTEVSEKLPAGYARSR
ncbi:MAG TPA: tetratricopeptide repeat protein [Bryobacteraceae bacterium]|nr:tetratricopeptide repeat protein [Bryobacteraceae bacterium]